MESRSLLDRFFSWRHESRTEESRARASLGLLIAIGVVDLLSTAILHELGLIVELNPIMRPLIERSEWLFAAVKGFTLVIGAVVMSRYIATNPRFVRRACLVGSAAYVTIWCVWFLASL